MNLTGPLKPKELLKTNGAEYSKNCPNASTSHEFGEGKDSLVAEESEAKRAILSIIAIEKGLRTHGKFLVAYSDDELLDLGAMMSDNACSHS